MTAFFVLYAITITIELILSLVMAVFLFLIMWPGSPAEDRMPDAPPLDRPLARNVDGALRDAFATISQGRDDLHTLTNARALLATYAREHDQRAASADR